MEDRKIYEDIALRTEGDIYIGVVGPVRTGKSTFIKSFNKVDTCYATIKHICSSLKVSNNITVRHILRSARICSSFNFFVCDFR